MNLSTRLGALYTLYQISVGRSWDVLVLKGSYVPLNRDFVSILKEIGLDIIGDRPFQPIPDNFWDQIHRGNAPQNQAIGRLFPLVAILSFLPVLAYTIAGWLLTTFILAPVLIAEYLIERPVVSFVRLFIGPETYTHSPLPIPRGVNSSATENAWAVQEKLASAVVIHPPLFSHAYVTNPAVIEVKQRMYFAALLPEIKAYVDTFADKASVHSLLDDDECETLIEDDNDDYRCPISLGLPEIPVKLGKKTYELNMLLMCFEKERGFMDPYTRLEVVPTDINLPDSKLMEQISEAIHAKASRTASHDENASPHLS